MDRRKGLFDSWIFETWSVTGRGLGLMRIFSALFLIFFLIPGEGTAHFMFLASLPPDFYSPPPGPMELLGQFPSHGLFQALHTLLIISLIAMLFGYYTRWASITAGFLILFLQGLIFSVGKIDHELLVALVPLVMAFSNWGHSFSIDSVRRVGSDEEPQSWPLTLLALFIGFMMFTAGFPKILGGWFDPSTQATQGHLFNQFFEKERQELMAPLAIRLDSVFFWEMLDWATIFFETGFIVAVWRSAWFRLFLAIAVLFHFSTMLTLNIAFLPNFLAYALFLNWDGIYEISQKCYQKISGKTGTPSQKRSVVWFTMILIFMFGILKWLSRMDLVLQNSDLMLHEAVLVTAAAVTVVYMCAVHVLQIRKTSLSQGLH